MPWYTYLLFGIYAIACFILIAVVLLQSGKGDIASAFGGGGSQTAFGPRGAASTLSRVTLGAAIAFMVLAFVFTIPGVLRAGSVAHDIEDAPAVTQPAAPAPAQPAPPAQPGQEQQPAVEPAKPDQTGQPGTGQQPPAATGNEQKPAQTPDNPEQKK
jgi:preprotein translocase subunit SecG